MLRGAAPGPAAKPHAMRLPSLRPVTAPGARPVVSMAKPTKIGEFRGMSAEEIDAEVEKCQRALYDLRVKKYTGQPFKSHEFKWYRRKVAQLLTERRAQEIAAGIGKRESRKAEKARLLEKDLWVR
eukprot:evm.model.scf_1440.3 EVM.evm.TU.scf_1440.3   scf_1440:7064-7441(-)